MGAPGGGLRTTFSHLSHLGASETAPTDYLSMQSRAWITLTASDTQKLLGRKVSFSCICSAAVASGFGLVCFFFFK